MSPRGRPSRQAVFDSLDRAVEDLAQVGGLPLPAEAEAIWQGIWYEETHHSTAIEGNTLILKQVQLLLEEGKAVGSKELSEYLEVTGYSEAALWVYRQASRDGLGWRPGEFISLTELREIHRLVVEPAWRQSPPSDLDPNEGPGAFRRHDIKPFAGGMTPPPWPDVSALATDWIKSANGPAADDRHLMEHLAEVHARFEQIHPFRDGNGRVGRLVLNLLLVKHGYPPAIIYKRDRSRYLRGLDRADHGDPGSLAELLARAVRDSIHRLLLPGLAGPHRLVPIRALADGHLSANALLLAAKRDRLRAVRKSDQWYSTQAWVDDYRASRYKRLV